MPLLREMDLPLVESLELNEAMATEMITRTPKAWHHLFRQHLLLSALRGRAEHEEDLSRVAIAFVDLTDSTRWPSNYPTPANRPPCRDSKTQRGRRLRLEGHGW